jgi:methylated-DNA-protein-cysteine methyltransferase-like protein
MAPTPKASSRSSALESDPRVQRILAVVDSIPKGRVASYGDVAREAHLSRNARLVGRVLSRLPSGSKLAWHRVVDAAGRIRVGGASSREQKRRLVREGVGVSAKNRVDAAFFAFRAPRERR